MVTIANWPCVKRQSVKMRFVLPKKNIMLEELDL